MTEPTPEAELADLTRQETDAAAARDRPAASEAECPDDDERRGV